MTGPACGNNPNHKLTDGDRQAVVEFRAYLTRRAALLEAAGTADELSLEIEQAMKTREIGPLTALQDLADKLRRRAYEAALSPYYEHPECGFHWHGRDGMDVPMRDGQPVCPRCELRRVADETAATETRAHEPLHQWRVEILDGDEWMPASGLRRDRSQAAEQLRMSSERRPLWKDGTQVQRRLVRETTTYTVEAGPAANCSCGVLRTGPGRHLPECLNGTAAGARQDGAQR